MGREKTIYILGPHFSETMQHVVLKSQHKPSPERSNYRKSLGGKRVHTKSLTQPDTTFLSIPNQKPISLTLAFYNDEQLNMFAIVI